MNDRFNVAEVARALGVSEAFLRGGEKKGKLPKARRDFNSWRVYTSKDIDNLRKLLLSPRK